MEGHRIHRFAVDALEDAINSVLAQANTTIDNVDLVIPHQANGKMLNFAIKRIGIDPRKCFVHIDECGNLGSASVAVALAEAQIAGRIHPGNDIILVSFGSGLTWGATLIKW